MTANLLLIFILIVPCVVSDDFDSFKLKMQEKVAGIANEMQSIYARRCDNDIVQCEMKSINLCEGTTNKQCFDNFPTAPECFGDGAYMSDESTIRFPQTVDPDNLSNQERQFVCMSALLDSKFRELNNDRNKQYTKAYLGTILGSHRSYPSTYRVDGETGECPDYDPRFRPWYTTGSSGAKNVVLIIDISGSMQGTRIEIAKEAAKSVVNTFSNNDFVGVVTFSNNAQTLYSNKLQRATGEFKTQINTEIDKIKEQGATNYQKAFEKAFDLVASAEADEYGAPCAEAQNVFLFLTDGNPTLGAQTSQDLIKIIDSLNSQFNIKLFTYALGSGVNTAILKKLSCAYFGIMFEIKDEAAHSELATQMRNYYIYLAQGVSITSPVWTEPYEDAFGFGRMVTVSLPVYYTENSVRKILGVVGIDVVMNTFYNFGFEDQNSVIKELIRNAPCHMSSLSECAIEELRPHNSQCGIQNCSASNSFDQCEETSTNIYQTSVTMIQDDNMCCGLTVAAFAVILSLAGIILIGVTILLIFYFKKKNQTEQSDEKHESNRNIKGLEQPSKKNMANPNPYFNQGIQPTY